MFNKLINPLVVLLLKWCFYFHCVNSSGDLYLSGAFIRVVLFIKRVRYRVILDSFEVLPTITDRPLLLVSLKLSHVCTMYYVCT